MRLRGNCPMGCGETLFAGEGGHVTCSFETCPDPGAVDTILSERETEHIVHFGESGFTIRHPLHERRGHELEECALHEHVQSLSGPPVKPGTYRVTLHGFDAWDYVEVEA
jgi:hypothetical protein